MAILHTSHLGITVSVDAVNFPACGPAAPDQLLIATNNFGPLGSFASAAVISGAAPPGVVPLACPTSGMSRVWMVGTPAAVGVYTYTVRVTRNDATTFDVDLVHTIALVGGCPLIGITPASPLDDVFVAEPVSILLAAANGVAPYTWDVPDYSDPIPAGLALSSGGLLSGAATAAGAYTFTVRATDANGCPGVIVYSLTVLVPDPIVVFPVPPLADGVRREVYDGAQFTATGGILGPYDFTITAGDLPPGLVLATTGELAGLITQAGLYTFTVRATDGAANFGEREYSITVSGLRILIGDVSGDPIGSDVTPEISACEIELGLNRQATARLEIGDAYVPARGTDVLIYERDGVTPIFGGLVLTRGLGGMAAGSRANKADIDCVDYSIYFDDADPVTLVSTVTQNLEDVIAAIVLQSLAIYGITYAGAATGITVPPIEWTAITVTDAFKRITDATGIVFRVLPLKELDIFRPLDDPAPVTITDANINAFDLSWRDPSNLPRNTVDLLCGPTGNGVTTQEWTADGVETSWEVDIQAVIGDYFAGARAHAFLGPTGAGNFTAGDTVTLGSSTYTFRASLVGDVAGEVLIGAGVNASLANLVAAIVGAGGGVYAPSTPVNTSADGYLRAPDQVAVNALAVGVAGNSIGVASSNGAVAFWYGEGGIALSALQLGADPAGASGWTQGYILEDGATTQTLGAPGSGTFYEWDVSAGRGTVSVGAGTTPAAGTVLQLVYLAVFPFHARVPSSLAPGVAPITFRENHPEIVSYAAGIAAATQILARESENNRELEVFTDVDGFLPGQDLDVNTTYRDGLVASFLVATVRITPINAEIWEYRLTCQESDEYAGSYVEQWKALTSGGGSSSSSSPGTLTAGGAIGAGDIYSDGRTSFRANQSMGGNKLTFVANPASAQDAATKASQDAGDAATLAAVLAEHYIKRDGSVAFTGDQSMGAHKLTFVANPVSAQDAATKASQDAGDASTLATVAAEHYIKRDGSVVFTGDQSMGAHKITNVTDPTSAQDAATKAYVDAGGGGTGKLVQVVSSQTGSVATGTTVIPFDDTIPQNTEGDQYMTLAITPTDVAHVLQIDVVVFASCATSLRNLCAALFQDSTANALACGQAVVATAGFTMNICFRHRMVAGTTSPTTFKVRIGVDTSGTTTFNGSGGNRKYGGVQASSITISEIIP
jgi:hypothetical protein